MAKQNTPSEKPAETPEVEAKAVSKGPVVSTNEEVEDLNATAEAARDPYAREPEVSAETRGTRGVVVETYS